MHFDENHFTRQCENERLRVSDFPHLLVVFKWHGSEGVNRILVLGFDPLIRINVQV